MATSHLPLRDSHHNPLNDLSLSQHRHPRNCFPHMVHTPPSSTISSLRAVSLHH
ncbi:hypothetical protein M422DRAFT_36474, partial [Sphaerobolus stellatus SS14]